MKNLLVLTVVCVSSVALAQQVELPRPSPVGKVQQTFGLTDVTIDYSSPGVKGRKIWGGVVPFGEVWRTGANMATKITFSKDVHVGGVAVPAGSYALFAIPNKASWTIILNKDWNQSGTSSYKKENDVVRFEVKPQVAPMRERLAYVFSDFGIAGGNVDLEWEKLRVSIPVKVNTDAQVTTNVKNMLDNAWAPYNQAARYMLEQKKDYDAGLSLVDKSLQVKEDWFNLWTKAQLLAAKGNYKDAYPTAQKAEQLGEKTPDRFFFKDEVKKALNDWKSKS